MLKKLLGSAGFIQAVELWPPGYSPVRPGESLQRQFESLCGRMGELEGHFDAFLMADPKVPEMGFLDPVVTSIRLKEKFPRAEVAPTIASRDRNRRALQQALATSMWAGIDNLVLVRGDPFHEKGQRVPANVYDVKRVADLVRMAREAQRLTGTRDLCLLTPVDVSKSGDVEYLSILKGRERASSDAFLSQPFMGPPEDYLLGVDSIRAAGVRSPIMANVFPLYSYDDAVGISKRFGMPVPRTVLDQLR